MKRANANSVAGQNIVFQMSFQFALQMGWRPWLKVSTKSQASPTMAASATAAIGRQSASGRFKAITTKSIMASPA